MKTKLTVYFTDGSSKMVEFEKPSGAHPTSKKSVCACIAEAERTGKKVETVSKTHLIGCDVWYDQKLWPK